MVLTVHLPASIFTTPNKKHTKYAFYVSACHWSLYPCLSFTCQPLGSITTRTGANGHGPYILGPLLHFYWYHSLPGVKYYMQTAQGHRRASAGFVLSIRTYCVSSHTHEILNAFIRPPSQDNLKTLWPMYLLTSSSVHK